MPHSSGGGSHGGGFHGGSHGSSHGRSTSTHFYKNYKPGRRIYRYCHRGVYHYMFTDRPIKKISLLSTIVTIIFLIPFIATGVLMFYAGFVEFMPPSKLKTLDSYESYHIEDRIAVIDNKSALEQTLVKFEENTGICPYVLTVYNSDWNRYSKLERFAYNEYVSRWSDEQHFLLVYSEQKNSSGAWIDWYWEGMQGDDTDNILSESKMNEFNKTLQSYLESEVLTTGGSIQTAFDYMSDKWMSGSPDIIAGIMTILFGISWTGFIVLALYGQIKDYINSNRDYVDITHTGEYDPNLKDGFCIDCGGIPIPDIDIPPTDSADN